MKKIIAGLFVLALAIQGVKAQDVTPDKHHDFKGKQHHHRDSYSQLNLTEDQKAKFKSLNEDFRKQMSDLKKNDNITVKDWKGKMESLRKDFRTNRQNLLTGEQKAQLDKMKEDRKTQRKAHDEARMDKMKTRLGLSDDQVAKLKASRTEMASKMKALHENKSLSDEQRKTQAMELRKSQKESLKTILTDEQLKKLHEKQTRRPAKLPA
jgi:Spy/CpxP family protein refolding chaperone